MSDSFNFFSFRKVKTFTHFSWIMGFTLCFFKINAAFPQNLNFSINELKNLSLVYEKAEDFEVERVIERAFRIDLGSSRNNLLVSARVISTANYAFQALNDDMYSVKLSDTDADLGGNAYRQLNLDFGDQVILEKSRRRGRRGGNSNYYIFNLIAAPVSYEYEPGQYHYSILFTVTED